MKKRFWLFLGLILLLLGPGTSYASEFDPNGPYDTQLLKDGGIEPLEVDEFDSVEELINFYLDEYGVEDQQISISYFNYENGESYYLNPHTVMLGASVYKLPLAAMYIDFINQGIYTWDTPISYNESLYVEGAGEITNMDKLSTYPLDYVIYEAIVHSDNTASWMLVAHHWGTWDRFVQAQQDFVQNWDLGPDHYWDSYLTSYQILLTLDKIAHESSYQTLIDWLKEAEPRQLFTSYVSEGMANKYGRMDGAVNDAGIYYEDDKPIYALVVLTDELAGADSFLEILSLRINEWARAHMD